MAGSAIGFDGTGAAASFKHPTDITSDGTNLYVVDSASSTIRKIVIATGVVSTFAGSGTTGSANGTGTAASFSHPYRITYSGGNLYVSDMGNRTIRKIVIATRVVSTLAGSGRMGAVDATGTAASFNSTEGITTDGTNLYVVDTGINTIRKIVIATGLVSTLAGSGTAGMLDGTNTAASFNYPRGIATDGTNLYVVDAANNKIRKIVIATGVVSTFAGSGASTSADGTGTAASFFWLLGITADSGNLYVTDGNTIRKIVIATRVVTTLAGSASTRGTTDGSGTSATFTDPAGITTDGHSLFVADTNNDTIRKIQY